MGFSDGKSQMDDDLGSFLHDLGTVFGGGNSHLIGRPDLVMWPGLDKGRFGACRCDLEPIEA